MACLFEVLLPASQRKLLMRAHRALDEVDRLESQMTVYRDDSEMAAINRRAEHEPVEVEERLFQLLLRGLRISRDTGGAFDMSAAPLTRCWGFFARQGRLPNDEEIGQALERVGWQAVELDEARRTVRFRRPIELNLGGIGKGYALDRAAEVLGKRPTPSEAVARDGASGLLLHAGHSTVLAFGGPSDPDLGWRVGIRHPLEPSRHCAVLRLRDQALSVSGVREQHFLKDGRTFGHILDPRTGRPAQGTLVAAAVAPSAAEADALSTAFFVMTAAEVGRYCRLHPGVGALIAAAGEGGAIDIQWFDLGEDSVEVLC